MKRFTTALAICALLIASGGVFAGDYTWSGGDAGVNQWADGDNWVEAGYPGGGATPRVIDRAEFTDGTPRPLILFDTNSGGSNCDCRTIIEFWMKPAAAVALTLQVTGDSLYVKQFFMDSTNAATTLDINGGAVYVEEFFIASSSGAVPTMDLDGGELHIGVLDITGDTTNKPALAFNVDVTVSEQTMITSTVDVQMTGGAVFDAGRLIITEGTID